MGGYWSALEGYTRHITMAQLFSFEDLAQEEIDEMDLIWKKTCSIVKVKLELLND